MLVAVFKLSQLLQFQGGEKLRYRDVDGMGGRGQDGEVLPCECDGQLYCCVGAVALYQLADQFGHAIRQLPRSF